MVYLHFRFTVESANPTSTSTLKVFEYLQIPRPVVAKVGWLCHRCSIRCIWMCVILQQSFLVGYPSLLAHRLSLSLNNPLIALHRQRPMTAGEHLSVRPFQPLTQSLPCDVHLLNLRSFTPVINGTSSLLFLHRLRSDCGVQPRAILSCDTQSSSRVCFISYIWLLSLN